MRVRVYYRQSKSHVHVENFDSDAPLQESGETLIKSIKNIIGGLHDTDINENLYISLLGVYIHKRKRCWHFTVKSQCSKFAFIQRGRVTNQIKLDCIYVFKVMKTDPKTR